MDQELKNLIESPEFKEYHKAQQDQPFNPFDVLRNADYEIRHSNVLAWLLDPGRNHGLGDKFLQEFVQHLNEQADKRRAPRIRVPSSLGADDIKVARELHHVDIIVFFRSADVLLAVENKTVEITGDHYRQVRGYERTLYEEYEDTYRDIRSILLTASPEGDISEREVLYVSWIDIHRILKSLHDSNQFAGDRDVRAFVRQYLDVIGRMAVQPGTRGDYFRKLLESHKPLLARLHEEQKSGGGAGPLRGEIAKHWSEYRETVGQVIRAFAQRPADQRGAVREYLKGKRRLETTIGSRGTVFWLYWELSDVAKALNFEACLVWALTFLHTHVTLEFYFPAWSNRPPSAEVRQKIVDFLKKTPIDTSHPPGKSDKYPMESDRWHYFYVYRNRLLDEDDLSTKSYEESLELLYEKLDGFFAPGSDYERIETYFKCLTFGPQVTVTRDTEGGSEDQP